MNRYSPLSTNLTLSTELYVAALSFFSFSFFQIASRFSTEEMTELLPVLVPPLIQVSCTSSILALHCYFVQLRSNGCVQTAIQPPLPP